MMDVIAQWFKGLLIFIIIMSFLIIIFSFPHYVLLGLLSISAIFGLYYLGGIFDDY